MSNFTVSPSLRSPNRGETPEHAPATAATILKFVLLAFLGTDTEGRAPKRHHGAGSMMVAFSANVASPGLPLIRYWTFNCLTTPGTGSPPRLEL